MMTYPDVTDAELSVLQVLWDHDGCTLRQLAEKLYAHKPLAGAHDHNFGYDGGFYNPPEGTDPGRNVPYTADGSCNAGCPQCNSGRNCPPSGCHHCGLGLGLGYQNGMPQHYQTQQFNWPQNMVYPQQGTPSGIVQYPYYTLRGPTDFFMK